jgi:hypothetical protein
MSETQQARREIETTEQAESESRAANLFDLRRLIGGLFLLYGVMLMVSSAFTSGADLRKAQGVNINLWTGLGMFALGAFFAVWAILRPLHVAESGGLKSSPDRSAERAPGGREHAPSAT